MAMPTFVFDGHTDLQYSLMYTFPSWEKEEDGPAELHVSSTISTPFYFLLSWYIGSTFSYLISQQLP